MDPRLPEPPGSPRLLRARGVGEILVDAFEIYRRHWQNLIAGFIVLTRLWVSMPAVVIEDRRGREALKRSWGLVTGYSWPVFGAIIVSGLLTGLFSGLLTAVFPDNLAGQAIGQSIATVLTTPYSVLVGILIYFSLRVRKEGYGVEDLERDLARTVVRRFVQNPACVQIVRSS